MSLPSYIVEYLAVPRQVVPLTETPTPITTLAETKEFLRVTTTANDAMIQSLIDAGQAEAVARTGYYWGTMTVQHQGYGNFHMADAWGPLVSIDTVEVNSSPVNYKTYLGGLVEVLDDLGQNEIVEMTYTVGSTTVKDDVKNAVWQYVRYAYDNGDNLPHTPNGVQRYFERLTDTYRKNWLV